LNSHLTTKHSNQKIWRNKKRKKISF